MRSWDLSVHKVKGAKTLALVAPHGTFPVASISAAVQQVIDALPDGTELQCLGEGHNISHVDVDRITGPLSVLETLLPSLPDPWVHSVGSLSLKRARLRIEKGEDARSDLRAAMNAYMSGIAADFARLSASDRQALAGAYAEWSRLQPASPEVLGLAALTDWSTTQL